MATITVNGTATRIFYENCGVEVTEFYTKEGGEQGKRTYTAWFETPVNFGTGVTGTFTGTVSGKIRDWIDKETKLPVMNQYTGKPGQSVDININGATFIPDGRPVSAATNSAPNYTGLLAGSDTTPF
jgi:hypothetical protein